MGARQKRADELSGRDFKEFPVWTFLNRDAEELLVRPVSRMPVRDLGGCLVGTLVVLANGTRMRAMLANVDVTNPRAMQHFLSVSIEHEGAWFHLARYFDPDYSSRGPAALAAFLGLCSEDVFPIAYDIRSLVQGTPPGVCGAVPLEPTERLSKAELIAMAVS